MPAGGCESRCEAQCRERELADDALGKIDRLPLVNCWLRAPSKRLPRGLPSCSVVTRHRSLEVAACQTMSYPVAPCPLSIVALSSQHLAILRTSRGRGPSVNSGPAADPPGLSAPACGAAARLRSRPTLSLARVTV